MELSKEEKEAFEFLKRIFHDISDNDAIDMVKMAEVLSEIGTEFKVSTTEIGEAIKRVDKIKES